MILEPVTQAHIVPESVVYRCQYCLWYFRTSATDSENVLRCPRCGAGYADLMLDIPLKYANTRKGR